MNLNTKQISLRALVGKEGQKKPPTPLKEGEELFAMVQMPFFRNDKGAKEIKMAGT
jgi:hypothetical protein